MNALTFAGSDIIIKIGGINSHYWIHTLESLLFALIQNLAVGFFWLVNNGKLDRRKTWENVLFFGNYYNAATSNE